MFSIVIKHAVSNMTRAPVVFIQYIAAIAIAQGIKSYDKGYENMPIKLKWPNDICKHPSPAALSSPFFRFNNK